MKKRNSLLYFGIYLFFLPLVSANFVCGQVGDYKGLTENVSASWFDVEVYYTENPGLRIKCDVSPQENKYCCDPLEIKQIAWKAGKEINGEILQGNYFASKVKTNLTSEGYSILPFMQLQKGIEVHSLDDPIYINASRIFINLSSRGIFSNLKYSLKYNGQESEIEICTNCNHSEFYIENLPYGENTITFIAYSSSGIEVKESKTIYILEFLNMNRKILCEGCKDNFIPSGVNVTVKIKINSSHEINGKLSDYFSNKWEYVSGGDFGEYSASHYKVTWEFEGKEVEKTYNLISPKVILTRKYDFFSSLENIKWNREIYVVYKFYKILGLKDSFSNNRIYSQMSYSYYEASNDQPVVMFIDDEYLTQFAIYPTNKKSPVYSYLNFKSPKTMQHANYHFFLDSTISEDEISQIVIRFKIEKPKNSKMKMSNAEIYNLNEKNNDWEKLEVVNYFEDNEFIYFESYSKRKGNFAIKREYQKVK